MGLNQVTLSGSVGNDVGEFTVYFDSACFSGSEGGPVTGSTFGSASIYSGSQLTEGITIDFPDTAQVAYIRTEGFSLENSGSAYCQQCFGPVNIPNSTEPPLSQTPTPTPTLTQTPTPTPTSTPVPVVSARYPCKIYALDSGGTYVGLLNTDDYCSANYIVNQTFYTDAPSFAALVSTTGYQIFDSKAGGADTFSGTNNKFAVGDSNYETLSVDEFYVLEVSTNGTVDSVTIECDGGII